MVCGVSAWSTVSNNLVPAVLRVRALVPPHSTTTTTTTGIGSSVRLVAQAAAYSSSSDKQDGMDLATKLNELIPYAESVEVIPNYLLPEESQKEGWCFIENVFGIVNKVLLKNYVQLCMQGIECSTPATTLLSVLATHENLKALNARKRMCLDDRIDPTTEFRITTVLLSSHLYKHSKSSMLWHHRRWLLKTFLLSSSVDTEFGVVEQAALHHPKNYYAWGYLRWWCGWHDVRSSPTELINLKQKTKTLCLQNLGDVSMWSFLHWFDSEDLETLARETDTAFPGHEAILGTKR